MTNMLGFIGELLGKKTTSVLAGRKVAGAVKGKIRHGDKWVYKFYRALIKGNTLTMCDGRQYIQTNRGPLVAREKYDDIRNPAKRGIHNGCAEWIKHD